MPKNLTVNDFSTICRLCINKDTTNLVTTLNILECYVDIIQKITTIKFNENDYLPKQFCNNCCKQLEHITNFIQICNKSNEILSKIHKESNIEINVKTDDKHCSQCQKYFKTELEYKNHMNDKYCMYSHGITCTICKFVATCKESLKLHDIREHKIEDKWKCTKCDKLYMKKYNLQLHLTQTHERIKHFKCSLCNGQFVTQGSLNRHIENMHGTGKFFECYICEKKFNRKDNLDAHMKNNHINKQSMNNFSDTFGCKVCKKTFSIQSYLENHLKTHLIKSKKNSVGFKRCKFLNSSTLCSICGKYLTNKKSYYTHMKRKHSNMEYKQKIYPKRSKNDDFQCIKCGKIIIKLQNLKIHMRIHSGEKPYKCKFCQKKFTHHTTWSAHENIHTGNKPFQCAPCNKGFSHRSCLRKHLRSRIHKEDKVK